MEQITLSGDEWASDGSCVVHKVSDTQLQITLKKGIKDKLGLKPKDIVKIYIKKDVNRSN